MDMLESEDTKTFKKLGFNFTLLAVVMVLLIIISLYFS